MSWFDDPIDAVKIMGVMFMMVMMLAMVPKMMDIVRQGTNPDAEGQYLNLTVVSKSVEYERGLLAPKKAFVLILSDGNSYRVTETIFELYDTGEPISIEIRDGKVIFS